MKKKLLSLLVTALLLAALLPATVQTAFAQDYDRILSYQVDVTPNVNDGSLAIRLIFRWKALEDLPALAEQVHGAGAKLVVSVNPAALGVLKSPGACGADIAVGEGQPLGMPLSFGGPYLGFMTCKKAMMRKLPGRIVGETKDDDGNRCFVLTLQAREQHIRREKASSNICSNEALCAMTASVYLAAMGPKGLRQAAESSAAHAHHLAGELAKLGFGLRSGDKPFFHEFLTDSPIEPETLCAKLEEQGILGGLPVDGGILWCCTECNSKAEIDRLIKVIGEVLA